MPACAPAPGVVHCNPVHQRTLFTFTGERP
ncbi:hypothetical protein [Pseudomonas phage vB_Pae_SG_WM_Sew_P3]